MSGSASGAVRWLLRLEGLSVLMAAMMLYGHLGLDWTTFAWWFLAPDIAFIGYLAEARNGATAYNITHSYPGGSPAASWVSGWPQQP